MSKRHFSLLLLIGALLLILIGCAPAIENDDSAAQQPDTTESTGDIRDIRWTLDHTIVGGDAVVPADPTSGAYLEISGDQAGGSLGCNSFNGPVTINGNDISFGALASTRMACEQGRMDTEAAMSAALASAIRYRIEDGRLILSDANGLDVAQFSQAEVKTLYVGPQMVECEGVAPQQCLQVKEDAAADYTLFYDTIGGFAFEPGYEYELRVAVSEVRDVPMDASSLRYTLVEVVNQTAVAGEGEGEGEVPAGEADDIRGIRWEMVNWVVGGDAFVPVPESVEAYLEITGAQASGSLGCNGFGAVVTIDGETIRFTEVISTMMACEDERGEVEQGFRYALENAASYRLNGDRLELYSADGLLLAEFAPASADGEGEEGRDGALEGIRWELVNWVVGGDAFVPVPESVEAYLEITGAQAGGSLGCNGFGGDVTIDGDAISFSNVISTMMACEDERGDVEAGFAEALNRAARYQIDGDLLTLYDADGLLLAEFRATDEVGGGESGSETGGTDAGPDAVVLQGTRWQWVRFEGGDGSVIEIENPADLWIEFNADGTYGVQADCNSGSGAYTVEGNSIVIAPGPLTLMMCAEGSMGTEFLNRLQQAVTFVFDDAGNLVLNMTMDAGNMIMTPAQ